MEVQSSELGMKAFHWVHLILLVVSVPPFYDLCKVLTLVLKRKTSCSPILAPLACKGSKWSSRRTPNTSNKQFFRLLRVSLIVTSSYTILTSTWVPLWEVLCNHELRRWDPSTVYVSLPFWMIVWLLEALSVIDSPGSPVAPSASSMERCDRFLPLKPAAARLFSCTKSWSSCTVRFSSFT